MNRTHELLGAGMALALVSLPSLANAQTSNGEYSVHGSTTVGEGTPSAALPPPRSSNDPRPPVAASTVPQTGIVSEAGIGGQTAYGRAGVLELGGSVGFGHAGDFTQVNVSPSIGWFFMDNVELSGIVGFNYASANGSSATQLNVLAEPSFHVPFSQAIFGFVGLGLGLGYSHTSTGTGGGAGFALAPRVGANFMVGRSGVFTPAVQFVYSTTDIVQTSNGSTLVGVSTSIGVNAGYTVMW